MNSSSQCIFDKYGGQFAEVVKSTGGSAAADVDIDNNQIVAFEPGSNDPTDVVPSFTAHGVSLSNFSDNHIRATITLEGQEKVTLVPPNKAEDWHFGDAVVESVNIVVVEPPVGAGIVLIPDLAVLASPIQGYIDIDFIKDKTK